MKKFEYISLKFTSSWTVKFDQNKIDKSINKLGEDGWELVNISHIEQGGYTKVMYFYFKREKVES